MKYTVGSPRAPGTMGKAVYHYLEHSGTYGILELKEVAVRIPSLYTSIYGIKTGLGRYISMSATLVLMQIACYMRKKYLDLL